MRDQLYAPTCIFSTLFFINFYGTAAENLFNHQDYSSLVIILFSLMTCMFDQASLFLLG